ncbi:uncharacterized protein N7484_007099 [Penicillium longicatenatum]|uniref:uncharacterized protein n=1 Tax=Penicillium longicatenatum TaxID=1561947 RepID=UPI002548AA0F|nr:uncharacterized protein N7484_007099 [Penicillium longicatenatum]KAJ5639237.1 hypothetical protein N7484_007099 [Penicillium longicatenatum]
MDLTQNEFIEVADAGRKGKGVSAKVNIPLGTRVMSEPALIELQLDDNGGFTSMQILQAFALLTPSQQVSFLELSGFGCPALKASVSEEFQNIWENIPELQRDVISIFRKNTFDGMLFLTGSRINHSCIPNLIFAYNPIIGKETFHAIRDIAAGEELTIMYIDGVNRPRK